MPKRLWFWTIYLDKIFEGIFTLTRWIIKGLKVLLTVLVSYDCLELLKIF